MSFSLFDFSGSFSQTYYIHAWQFIGHISHLDLVGTLADRRGTFELLIGRGTSRGDGNVGGRMEFLYEAVVIPHSTS